MDISDLIVFCLLCLKVETTVWLIRQAEENHNR